MDIKLVNCQTILIETNQNCNLNCTYCFYRDYGRSEFVLKLSDVKKIVSMCPHATQFFITGGECFLVPDIVEIIEYLSSIGKVYVFTNGIILNQYNDVTLLKIINMVEDLIVSFDSFDFENYKCRSNQNETLELIIKLININSSKIEVKVCINHHNLQDIDETFEKLICLGVKKLSVNFVFDIENSNQNHEVKTKTEIKKVFETIYKFQNYFDENYIKVLHDFYMLGIIPNHLPCVAGNQYFYVDCHSEFFICPGNTNKIGMQMDWEKCISNECINQWEIMYRRKGGK